MAQKSCAPGVGTANFRTTRRAIRSYSCATNATQLRGLFARPMQCGKSNEHHQVVKHVCVLPCNDGSSGTKSNGLVSQKKSALEKRQRAGQHSLPEFINYLRKAKLTLLLSNSAHHSCRSGDQDDIRSQYI